MERLRDFEVEAIRRLGVGVLSSEQIARLATAAAQVEERGAAYMVIVADPSLAAEKWSLTDPVIAGEQGEILCGFSLTIDGPDLALQCRSSEGKRLPRDFRDRPVRLFEREKVRPPFALFQTRIRCPYCRSRIRLEDARTEVAIPERSASLRTVMDVRNACPLCRREFSVVGERLGAFAWFFAFMGLISIQLILGGWWAISLLILCVLAQNLIMSLFIRTERC